MSNLKDTLYPQTKDKGSPASTAQRRAKAALWAELISGVTGVMLSGFILGHLVLESSLFFLGKEIYSQLAYFMEHTVPMAQPLIFIIMIIFFVHFVMASRKIPGKLYQRKRMMELGKSIKNATANWAQDPNSDITLRRHRETTLWIWQVRTGMIVLALGSFHLILALWNIFTNMGHASQTVGLTYEISTGRVESGLWILYLFLGISVVTHLAIGIYRLLVKWFADTWLTRKTVMLLCFILCWIYLALNLVGVWGLAGLFEGVLL